MITILNARKWFLKRKGSGGYLRESWIHKNIFWLLCSVCIKRDRKTREFWQEVVNRFPIASSNTPFESPGCTIIFVIYLSYICGRSVRGGKQEHARQYLLAGVVLVCYHREEKNIFSYEINILIYVCAFLQMSA